jgi:hypothetical protein
MKKRTGAFLAALALGIGIGIGVLTATAADPTIVLTKNHFAGGGRVASLSAKGDDLRSLLARIAVRLQQTIASVNGVCGATATDRLNVLIGEYNKLRTSALDIRTKHNTLDTAVNDGGAQAAAITAAAVDGGLVPPDGDGGVPALGISVE